MTRENISIKWEKQVARTRRYGREVGAYNTIVAQLKDNKSYERVVGNVRIPGFRVYHCNPYRTTVLIIKPQRPEGRVIVEPFLKGRCRVRLFGSKSMTKKTKLDLEELAGFGFS